MAKSEFRYVTYIRTTPQKLWTALTDPEWMKQYWFGMHCESDFKKGSSWKLVGETGDVWDAGEILEADPPRKLVIRWTHQEKPELKAEGPSICTMEISPEADAVKLSIVHGVEHEHSKLVEAVSGGWPKILSNLKSLLEVGASVMSQPYPTAKAG
jgi:uncharacterized protein YndB with AHSA1/START domain